MCLTISRITQINTAMLDQYLAREEEFLGKTPNQLFAHDVEHGRSLWRKMFDQGFLSIDSNERRFDGSQLCIVGSYRCMYDEQGRITGHFGTQHDITDLKQAEEITSGSTEREGLPHERTQPPGKKQPRHGFFSYQPGRNRKQRLTSPA